MNQNSWREKEAQVRFKKLAKGIVNMIEGKRGLKLKISTQFHNLLFNPIKIIN